MEYADVSVAFAQANPHYGAEESESAIVTLQTAWHALETHMSEHGGGLRQEIVAKIDNR
jgi:hypothetical protein